jgi:hypothetical protein
MENPANETDPVYFADAPAYMRWTNDASRAALMRGELRSGVIDVPAPAA